MVDAIISDLRALETDLLEAVQHGSSHVADVCLRMDAARNRLHAAAAAGGLPDHVWDIAQTTFTSILHLSMRIVDYDSVTEELIDEDDTDDFASSGAAIPLFRYFLDNICHPYPDSEEKEHLADAARQMGWRDFDKRKCEDWLNRKRHQSGYVAIARKYCDEDLDAMRTLCYAALFGSPEQQAEVHPSAFEEIEEMRDLLQSQYDELAGEDEAKWVDDLTSGVRAILGDTVETPTAPGLLSEDNKVDDADQSDFADEDEDYDDESDTDESITDVDSDCDNDNDVDALPPVTGTKRKMFDLPTFAPPRSRAISRTPSPASSANSGFSALSFRSFSGHSMSSATSWEEDECERPAKRTRSESFSPEPEPSTSSEPDLRTKVDLWAMRVPSSSVALSKRKRDDDDLETLARNMKRSRYAALSAAAPSNIPAPHLTSLTDVCTRSWSSVVPFEVLSFSVDSELYTVDCTAMQASDDDGEDEDEDNNLADIIDLCNDPDAPDDATWATVQLHALAQTLTGSRLPMAAELCADTVEVKLEELSPQELSSLGETLATTAESITAEYPLDQSLLLEDDDAFNPPELSDGESSGSSSPDRSPSPPVELESSPERLIADYAMSTRTRKELDTLQHPWFAQVFGQQGLSFFDPNTFRVECNPPPGMMAQESHPDVFLAQLDL